MGEVYRARDTRLAREVAIKVLPEAFARDAARSQRFEHEARVLSTVNHPNILQFTMWARRVTCTTWFRSCLKDRRCVKR